MERSIVILRQQPQWKERAAAWFHSKWGIPLEAYLESMEEAIQKQTAVPQWYMVTEGDRIVAGVGIIENDFHKRKDLTPNVCAVYVEEDCRKQGLARQLLDLACADLRAFGVPDVYLLTDHTNFYEHCGWAFLCMVEEDGGGTARCYHRTC